MLQGRTRLRMANVNVMCSAEGVPQPCAACRCAGRALERRGLRVHYSSRYDALRAAVAGGYGFDACVVSVGSKEPAIADAVIALFADKKVAIVSDDGVGTQRSLPDGFVVLRGAQFERAEFPEGWLGSL